MPYDVKAAGLTPPCGGKNIIVLDSATSSARLKLPASWRTSIITVQADGVDVYVAFGGTSITASQTAVTTLSSEAPSAHAAGVSYKIPNGQERNFDMTLIGCDNPGNANQLHAVRMAHIESAAGGWVRVYRSSGPVHLNESGIA